MAHFDSVVAAPADPILGLTDAFKADSRPQKINLGVGVFIDDHGVTPVLASVHAAEERLVAANATKSYLPITGSAEFARLTQALCFDSASAAALAPLLVTTQTPGGTGGLRVAADFLSSQLSKPRLHVSNPTWANHPGVFNAAGLAVATYPYFDKAGNCVDFEAFTAALAEIPAGEVVLLHTCCHNPTGADLSPEQWETVAALAQSAGWLPFLDFAYQGFGTGIEADAAGVHAFVARGLSFIVAQSFSKNFGLYQDRVGALHIVTSSPDEQARVNSQVKATIRTNYSNPPAHGGDIVRTILGDATLRAQWEDEVTAMRERIHRVRHEFVQALRAAGVSRDFGFLLDQRGMFSFTGLSPAEVQRLRDDFGVFMVASGRINVAGINQKNLAPLVAAFKAVIG